MCTPIPTNSDIDIISTIPYTTNHRWRMCVDLIFRLSVCLSEWSHQPKIELHLIDILKFAVFFVGTYWLYRGPCLPARTYMCSNKHYILYYIITLHNMPIKKIYKWKKIEFTWNHHSFVPKINTLGKLRLTLHSGNRYCVHCTSLKTCLFLYSH